MNEVVKAVVAIALLVAMFAVGMALPICTTKSAWIYIVMAYLFLASVMPMWLLMQPRDYMTTFMPVSYTHLDVYKRQSTLRVRQHQCVRTGILCRLQLCRVNALMHMAEALSLIHI